MIHGRGGCEWWMRLRRRQASRTAVTREGQDGQFEADLLSTLPRGLVAAVPGVTVPALFVATAQARAGKSSRELVRMFGLSLRDAKTILAYTTTTDGNGRRPQVPG